MSNPRIAGNGFRIRAAKMPIHSIFKKQGKYKGRLLIRWTSSRLQPLSWHRIPFVGLWSAFMAGLLTIAIPVAAEIKSENGVWYEYAPRVTSPYTQNLNIPQTGTGVQKEIKPERALQDKAYGDAVTQAQSDFWNKLKNVGVVICDKGYIDQQESSSETTYNGSLAGSTQLLGGQIKKYPDRPCDSSNIQYIDALLVTRNMNWQYTCPHGFSKAPETPIDGPLYCRRPLDYCPGMCGNPVTHTSTKLQPELDYRSADGLLQFERVYSSARYPSPGWTHTYDTKVEFTGSTAAVIRPDGSRLHFQYNGTNFVAIQPTKVRLSKLAAGYAVVSEDDKTETYNESGSLTQITLRNGKTIKLTKSFVTNEYGQLIKEVVAVSDPYGRRIQIEYAPSSHVPKALVQPDGSIVEYSYSSETGTLIRVAYPNASRRTYSYGALFNNTVHNLVGIADEKGVTYANFAYQSGSAVRTTTMHAGSVERYDVDDYRFLKGAGSVEVREPLGLIQQNQYAIVNGISRLVSTTRGEAGTVSRTYDGYGNLATYTDSNGNLTRYSFDPERHLELSRTEGLTSAGAATAVARTIETTWHDTFNLPTKIIEKTASGTILRQTDTDYDTRGNVISRTVSDGNSTASRTTSWNYTYSPTVAGHVEKLVIHGPRTDVEETTTIDYWPADEVCNGSGVGQDKGCRGQIKSMTNALGQITHYTDYDANGRLLSQTDPNGVVTTFTYSARGWLTSKKVGAELTTYDYDGVGQMTKVTHPDGSFIRYTYDDAHRLTDIADGAGNSIHYTLDLMGNRIREEVKDADGALARQVTREYDALNRLQQITGGRQ